MWLMQKTNSIFKPKHFNKKTELKNFFSEKYTPPIVVINKNGHVIYQSKKVKNTLALHIYKHTNFADYLILNKAKTQLLSYLQKHIYSKLTTITDIRFKNSQQQYQLYIEPLPDNNNCLCIEIEAMALPTRRQNISSNNVHANRQIEIRALQILGEETYLEKYAAIGIFNYKKFGFTDYNQQLIRLFGITEQNFNSQKPYEFLPLHQPDGSNSILVLKNKINETLKNTTVSYDLQHKTVNGQPIYLSVTTHVINNDNGTPSDEILVIFNDSGYRKKQLADLRTTTEKYKLLYENSPVGVVLYDAQKKLINANQAFTAMLDYTEAELKQMHISSYTHPEDIKQEAILFKDILLNKTDVINLHKRYIHKKGHYVWTSLSLSVKRNKNNAILYIIAYVKNIDNEKRQQQQLAEKEELYRALFNNNYSGLALINLNTLRVEKSNLPFQEMMGYSEVEINSLTTNQLLPSLLNSSNSSYVSELKSSLIDGQDFILNEMHTRKNLTEFNAAIKLSSIELHKKQYALLSIKDISLDVKQQEELHESQQHFELIFDSNALGMILLNNDNFTLNRFNEAFASMLGYQDNDLLQRKIDDFLPPNNLQLFKQKIQQINENQLKYFTLETPCVCANKSIIYTKIWVCLLRSQNEHSILCTVQNVTEQQQSLKLLQESEARFKSIFENNALPMGLRKIGEDFICDVNNAFYKVFGWNKAETIGYNKRKFIHKDDSLISQAVISQLLLGEINIFKNEVRVLSKFKGYIWCRTTATVVKIGRHRYLLTSIQNINDIKLQEDILRESEEKYKALFSNTQSGILLVDLEKGTTVDANKRMQELFLSDRACIMQGNIISFSPHYQPDGLESAAKLSMILNSFRKTKEVTHFDWQFKRNNGVLFHAEVSINPITVGNQQLTMLQIRDINKRKVAALQLEEKNKKLDQKNEELKKYIHSNLELENFAYVASHDLREPLRTIAGFTQLLQRRYYDQIDEDGKTYMDFVVKATKNLNELIEALLKFSVVNTSHTQLKIINMPQLVESLNQKLANQISSNNATINWVNLPTHIRANRVKIEQLFQNLISNGIKFKKEGVSPVITITAKDESNYWLFSVADNGIGIEKEYFDKIFLLFKRLNNKDTYEGTGIGLSLCKKIIEQHHGKIWLSSTHQKGTTFYFTISKTITKT